MTAECGRVDAVVRGARSSRKRGAGVLDLGARVEFEVQKGRGELPDLGHFALVQVPKHTRDDVDRLALCAYGCELCAAFATENQESPRLFGLLEAWLARLEGDAPLPAALRVALEVKALHFAGLTPALGRCPVCADASSEPAVFSMAGGGLLHARCGGGRRTPVGWAVAVERLRTRPMSEAEGVSIDTADRWLLMEFAEYHLGRPLKSRARLEHLAP